MARSRSQTATGQAVYLLNYDLRLPSDPATGKHFRWLSKGTDATESELSGLVVPALVEGGFLEKKAEAQFTCEACEAHGSQAEKKKHYLYSELIDHYRKDHPGLAPPEEG